MGCFSLSFIRAGDVVERWQGEVVTDDQLRQFELQGKYHSSIAIGENENLLLNLIDASSDASLAVGSGVGGFNHSCDPNLWMADAVTVIARRDIQPGEELTIDEALISTMGDWQFNPCNCGSSLCRGTITGNDWQLAELQQRYAGHFSPFINERIQRLQRGIRA